jgi:hypothetical protein
MKLNISRIEERQAVLSAHPLFTGNSLKSLADLHIFMEHHVYAVWDFMSLIKSLQHHVCPSTECWVPTKWARAGVARLINEIVLGEESDVDMSGNGTITHHDLYAQAMLEIGANGRNFEAFIERVRNYGFDEAMGNAQVPPASASFMRTTFSFIHTKKPHVIAGAFAFGRETLIPDMFTSLLNQMKVTEHDAPKFHYYLQRHIDIDGGEHGPSALHMVETLCEHDPVKIHEAEQAALSAIDARIRLWDKVYAIINDPDETALYSELFATAGVV